MNKLNLLVLEGLGDWFKKQRKKIESDLPYYERQYKKKGFFGALFANNPPSLRKNKDKK
jgi:hypothetical protein